MLADGLISVVFESLSYIPVVRGNVQCYRSGVAMRDNAQTSSHAEEGRSFRNCQ